jgi:hypothetical protein
MVSMCSIALDGACMIGVFVLCIGVIPSDVWVNSERDAVSRRDGAIGDDSCQRFLYRLALYSLNCVVQCIDCTLLTYTPVDSSPAQR